MRRDHRGLRIFTEFSDTYGNRVLVKESSSAGRARCWIFCRSPGEQPVLPPGVSPGVSPHLSKAQARRVAKALLRFANEGRA